MKEPKNTKVVIKERKKERKNQRMKESPILTVKLTLDLEDQADP